MRFSPKKSKNIFFAQNVLLRIVSMKLKTDFEYALWLVQNSVLKMCYQMFYSHNAISIKKMFTPITNVLNAVKCKPRHVAQIGFLFQTRSLKDNILSEKKFG